jgi:hypothetical protein
MELKVTIARNTSAVALSFLGIHSMELKVIQEAIAPGGRFRKNPFNGIESSSKRTKYE